MWFNAKMFVFVFSRPEQNNMSKLHSQLHTTPLGNKAQKFEYFKAYVSLKVVHPLINGNSILTVFFCIQYNTIMFHNYIFVLFEISFFLITLNSLSWWVIADGHCISIIIQKKQKLRFKCFPVRRLQVYLGHSLTPPPYGFVLVGWLEIIPRVSISYAGNPFGWNRWLRRIIWHTLKSKCMMRRIFCYTFQI